jgi:prolyl-tRNA synthetase
VAVNKEIIEDQKYRCPECRSKKLRKEKAVEVGNIFKLGTKYSAPFGLSYVDKSGKKQAVVMGCYGISPQRSMGTIVEVYHDNKGIVWPESVAPFKVILISISGKNVSAAGEKIYRQLIDRGIEILYDDRDVSAGEKFADADLIGIPIRIIVSAKTLAQKSVEIKKRGKGSAKLVKISTLSKIF